MRSHASPSDRSAVDPAQRPTLAERERAQSAALERQARLTKPTGSLGRLEALTTRLAFIQASAEPRSRPVRAAIFAADHPVARHGVSAYPQAVTGAMLRCFSEGTAAATVLASAQSIPIQVLDVGVLDGPDRVCGDFRACSISRAGPEGGAGDLRREDALTRGTFESALTAGTHWAAAAMGDAPELAVAILGEIGIANTTPAAAVAARLLGCDPDQMVGPGTGVTGAELAEKQRVVRDALERIGSTACSPDEVLRRLGGRDMVAMVGAMLGLAGSRCAVLVDGFIASVAALAAVRIDPAVATHLIFAHASAEPGHRAVLEAMDAVPLLDLGMRLGEASGALTAFPLLELACELHRRMATFEESAVPDRQPATPPRPAIRVKPQP